MFVTVYDKDVAAIKKLTPEHAAEVAATLGYFIRSRNEHGPQECVAEACAILLGGNPDPAIETLFRRIFKRSVRHIEKAVFK